jgi:23S rRNA (cytidine1920-2'-O)/16S rRNA (cytidine1409-2'-O)-methyltransferase
VPGKVRVDQRVLELGLAETRARAQAYIRAGDVRWADRVVDKPGALVPADACLELRHRSPYVSRGGEKLAGALETLAFDPAGLRCADVGASTGGFTDCLLQHGAREVWAIDVGYGQLAARLRDDPRVVVLERTNVRHFARPPEVPAFDLVTADLSFISLRLVLDRLIELARPGGAAAADGQATVRVGAIGGRQGWGGAGSPAAGRRRGTRARGGRGGRSAPRGRDG